MHEFIPPPLLKVAECLSPRLPSVRCKGLKVLVSGHGNENSLDKLFIGFFPHPCPVSPHPVVPRLTMELLRGKAADRHPRTGNRPFRPKDTLGLDKKKKRKRKRINYLIHN